MAFVHGIISDVHMIPLYLELVLRTVFALKALLIKALLRAKIFYALALQRLLITDSSA